MYCIKCGKVIPDHSRYCQECGEMQGMVPEKVQEKKMPKKKVWYFLIPFFLMLCVGAGIFIFYQVNNNKIIGEWTLESISGVTVEDFAKQNGKSKEQAAVNVSIKEDKILLTTINGDSGLDMELIYEKKDNNVLEAYPNDNSVMFFSYDSATDKITVTREPTDGTVNNYTTLVLIRGTTDFSGQDTSAYQEDDERTKEIRDAQTLGAIGSAFQTAIANLGIDECDSTELEGELAQEMERLLGKSVDSMKAEFVSQVCKGQDLYFYADPISKVIRVSIGSREGLHGKASDEVFCVGTR